MIKLKGQKICGGIAFGELFMFTKDRQNVRIYSIDDVAYEITRLNSARRKAADELEELYKTALDTVGKDEAAIFHIHRIMLEDEDFYGNIIGIIRKEKINSEAAVDKTCKSFVKIFENMEDSYMRERKADVKDISDRLINILSGNSMRNITVKGPVIVAAHTLTPSETVRLGKSKILAFVTETGSDNSHTAFLARSMNIPSITAVPELMNGKYAGKKSVIDGFNGIMYIEPNEEILKKICV